MKIREEQQTARLGRLPWSADSGNDAYTKAASAAGVTDEMARAASKVGMCDSVGPLVLA